MQGFVAVKVKDLTLPQHGFILVASVRTCQLYMKSMTIPHTEFEKSNASIVGRLECTYLLGRTVVSLYSEVCRYSTRLKK